MPITPFKLLLIDAASHAALLADGPSGEIVAELPLPPGFSPVDLITTPCRSHAFITLAGHNGTGTIYTFNPEKRTLARLPITIPHPAQFTPGPDGQVSFLADPAGTLYALDRVALTVAEWGKPQGCEVCVGLTADEACVYGLWETGGGGLLAAYNQQGDILRTIPLGGVPTSLVAAPRGLLLVTFTASPFSGEGLLVLPRCPDNPPVVVALQCSRCAAAHPSHPIHAAASPDGCTAYVACEDSAVVAVVDITAGAVSHVISLGRSISRLALVGEGRFAVASSNANADLCLLDLVNGRPLAFTASQRQFLSPLAVVE